VAQGNLNVVGVGDAAVSSCSGDVLITYSLGSCIGLTLYDPAARVGGLLHAQMPLSTTSPDKARERPAMFVDTGVAGLLQAVLELGASRRTLIACVAGAASNLGDSTFFEIGRRNHVVLRKMLWKNDIMIAGEEVGGTVSRTLSLDMSAGRTILKRQGSAIDLYLPPRQRGETPDAV
jgi:chemotaxis protein CheD